VAVQGLEVISAIKQRIDMAVILNGLNSIKDLGSETTGESTFEL